MNPDSQLIDWVSQLVGVDSLAAKELAKAGEEAPGRISRAYGELLAGYETDASSVLKPTRMLERGERASNVEITGIDFISVCPHHFLPYFGTASVAYLPKDMIVGIGKVPRLVRALAGRLQIQEDLTREIAFALKDGAGAHSATVEMRARHLCMCYRGPASLSAQTITSFSTT